MRRGVLLLATLVSLMAGGGASFAQTVPAWPADAARVDLIERASRSILHVKGVMEQIERPDPMATMTEAQRQRLLKRDPNFFDRIKQRPVREAPRSEGSAFVFDSTGGLALTTAHVVRDVKTLTVVTADGKELPATVVGSDLETGIAVIRYTGATLPALPLASRTPRAGETALLVGRVIPLNAPVASQGMVMGMSSVDNYLRDGAPTLVDFVALDNLLAQGGMGGGPAITMRGDVFAIASIIFGRGYGQEAMTLAVPLADLRETIATLVRDGKMVRGFIGLNYDCSNGACVVQAAASGMPAAVAGMQPGDILKSVDGKPVTSWSALRRHVAMRPVGSVIKLGVERGGKPVTADVKSIPTPELPDGPDILPGPAAEEPF